MKKILLLLAVALLVSSCATMKMSKDEKDIYYISDLINTGDDAYLAKMSQLPFLVDQEIIVLEKDVAAFWANIIKAGFTVEDPVLESGLPVDDTSYMEFYDSMEVETFFKKYVPAKARLLELETGEGQRILLIVEKKWLSRKLYAFKGPF